ncbi:MAG: metallophosphoesterase, partial [Acidobacteriota bacterium]
MASSESITLLHLSDPQFGLNHRFGRLDEGLRPEILILSGDLAERGLRSEFRDALALLQGLCQHLGLGPDRVVIIPGNHDINRKACESYFNDCEADEVKPLPPYWPKWRHYHWMFHEFYKDCPQMVFAEEQPWSLFEFPDCKVVIAGLNSTMKESHSEREEDHYGWVGEKQLRWFTEQLAPYRDQGWLRIGAVHHNPIRGAVSDDENLQDYDDLKRLLAPSLNFILHGHTHDGKLQWLDQQTPVLSTGSAALEQKARPEEVPNQYQVLRIQRRGLKRWTRQYAPDMKGWMGDNRASQKGDQWWSEHKVDFQQVSGAFPESGPAAPQPKDGPYAEK